MNTKTLLAAAAVLMSLVATSAARAEVEAYSYEDVRQEVRDNCVGDDSYLIDHFGYTYCITDGLAARSDATDPTATGSVSPAGEAATEAR